MSAAVRRPAREDGSITPLLIAFALCLAVLVSAVVDVSASYLRRQSAASLADGAALSASDAAAAAAGYVDPDRGYVPLDEGAATRAVAAYLRGASALADYPGLTADVQVVGHVVTVQLAMPYDLPISVPGASDAIVIRVDASAELPVY